MIIDCDFHSADSLASFSSMPSDFPFVVVFVTSTSGRRNGSHPSADYVVKVRVLAHRWLVAAFAVAKQSSS